jgi:hypothetical protein
MRRASFHKNGYKSAVKGPVLVQLKVPEASARSASRSSDFTSPPLNEFTRHASSIPSQVPGTKFRDHRSRLLVDFGDPRKFEPVTTFAEST